MDDLKTILIALLSATNLATVGSFIWRAWRERVHDQQAERTDSIGTLRETNASLRQEILELKQEVKDVRKQGHDRVNAKMVEMVQMNDDLGECEQARARMEERNQYLERHVAELTRRIAELEERDS